MSDIGYKIFYVNNKLQLVEKEESFDFKKNQIDPQNKNYNYIQNFIFIHDN